LILPTEEGLRVGRCSVAATGCSDACSRHTNWDCRLRTPMAVASPMLPPESGDSECFFAPSFFSLWGW
jgi:hypothetical protein